MNGKLIKKLSVFSLVLFSIFFVFFCPGYIFMLDFVFVPDMTSAEFADRPSYLFHLLIDIADKILPGPVIQRIILVTILILGIFGMRTLIRYFNVKGITAQTTIFGILLYILNPFVYSRFMTGQVAILLGYVLIPFFVVALMGLLERPTWRHAIIVTLWYILISIVSIHTLGLLIVISVPLIGLYVYRHMKDWVWIRDFSLKCVGSIGMFIVASCYWLIPALIGKGSTAQTVSSFGTSDFAAFATNSDTFGILGNILLMRGFWGDAANLYLVPEDVYSWWLIPLFFLSLLIILGVFRGLSKLCGLTIALIIIFVLSVILATGTYGSIFAPVNEWLVAHIPFFAGYREPQKFVAVVALVYTLFACFGVQHIIEWLQRRIEIRQFSIDFKILVLIIPIAIAPLMLRNTSSQLQGSDYPKDWYSMNDYFIQNVKTDDKVLALPWHMYMRFDFSNRVIANPMDAFFVPRLIMSDDPEYKEVRSYSTNAEQRDIDQLVRKKNSGLISYLASHNIHYILIAKEFDYKKFDYLEREKGIKILRDTDRLRLYKVELGNIKK